MRIGVVIGSVWATRKEPKLEGLKLLIVAPLDYKMQGNVTREPYIAADVVDAGIGDRVLIVNGNPARYAVGTSVPIDAAIVGVIDDTVLSDLTKF
ncbi:MAG: EutN/CcmL family microcompartment protein [Oscillospiraceae bacterium]|nr:EutN/CcmL family microcompartment protein [Oscillospiraceae bacterium]MBQ3499855.1 EutN/CcmL family microcompartment protein [Oscillospiraceae bacterium]MBQ6700587.1 EutN/CcmL family microcompartment protein [Oscillospiraceae bacterium]MBR2042025.1 EutN/CcmL family microcompartment protein [Oscillospiraceae bacterium]MBR3611194.1 EutN/CcmL family microcompartment protein [Oscillospiraceae bacterium]